MDLNEGRKQFEAEKRKAQIELETLSPEATVKALRDAREVIRRIFGMCDRARKRAEQGGPWIGTPLESVGLRGELGVEDNADLRAELSRWRERAEKAEATVESLVARIEDAEAVLSTGREP